MISDSKLQIACCINEGYVMPLCGMLSSLFAHHPGRSVCLHLVAEPLTPESQNKIARLIGKFGADYHFYTIPSDSFQDLTLICSHFAKANFYRLLIPNLISTTDRILYLDVDILIRKSLESLYLTELGSLALAAAPDAYPPADCKRLGLPEHLSYFNSGILVMDLPAWRREKISEKATQYLIQYNGIKDRCRYADQDGLNAVLEGQWKHLPETWNFNIYYCSIDPRRLPEIRRSILKEGPAIVHYADRKKPWMRDHILPYQQEFLKHARKQGIHFPSPYKLKKLWPRIQEIQRVNKIRSHYKAAGIAWRS